MKSAPNAYPASHQERSEIASTKLDKAITIRAQSSPVEATNFLRRLVCDKTWTELEAYHFANGQIGMNASDVLKYTRRSARPFDSILEGSFYTKNPAAKDRCANRFREFCEEVQAHVPWVKALLEEAEAESLYKELGAHQMTDEIEAMSDPT